MFCCIVLAFEIEVGDLLMFSMRGTQNTTTHVGIYTGNGYFIHSNQSVGKVVEERLNDMWGNRLVCAYRWKQWQL